MASVTAGRGRRAGTEGVVLVLLAATAAAVTAGVDAVLLARVHAGTDNALRLAAILTYVGVDGSYTLARSLGITALLFAYASVVAGLLAADRQTPGRAPNRLLGVVHRQAGLLTLVLVAGHAAVPFTSAYSPYQGWPTNFVPFRQPVSWGIKAATWESLGILAFYLAVLTGPTYYLAGRRTRWWGRLHRTAAAVYVLAVVHAFFLGTDFLVRGPARVAILAAQVPLVILVARRLAGPPGVRRRVAMGLGLAASAALAALSAMVATGVLAAGTRL